MSEKLFITLAQSISDLRNRVTALAREPGPAGKDGLNGKDGESGINGRDGKDGLNGKDGKSGINGRDGKDGKSGISGRDGKDGATGPMPKHEWRGTELRFQKDQETWGKWVDLRGPPGSGSVAVLHTSSTDTPNREITFKVGPLPISGHTVVACNALGELIAADATNPAHRGAVLGMVADAYSPGDDAVVQTGYVLEHAGWAWTPGPVLVGLAGQLSQAPPAGALFGQVVGQALSSTRVLIDVQPPITLA